MASVTGLVFIDGSCFDGRWQEVARAGWAWLILKADFEVLRCRASTVPGVLQDSAIAEYSALADVISVGVLPLVIVTDHKNMVDSWYQGRDYCLSYKHPF